MTLKAFQRKWRRQHTSEGRGEYHDGTFTSWAQEPSDEHPFHRDDGVSVSVLDRDDGSWDAIVGSDAARDRHEDA